MPKEAITERGLGLHIPFQIGQLHSVLNAQAKVILARHGDLNLAQWRIIRIVALGIADTTTAARKTLGIDKSQFSKSLSNLEKTGYIQVLPFEFDKRQYRIELTEKGRKANDRIGPELDARQTHLVASLSEEEQATFQKALKALAEAAKKTDFAVSPQSSETV